MEEEKKDVIDVKKLLKSVVKHGASDLHLVSRSEPQIRISGKLKPVNLPVLTGDDIEEMCYSLITEKQKQTFEEHDELDFAIMLPGIGRFRGNYYRQWAIWQRLFVSFLPRFPHLTSSTHLRSIKRLSNAKRVLFL